ncbi:hypothetical protein KC343_g4647 [Hortaea werneckii]|nr:hypothetical protein KC338_g2556 [Hortaea werneckii]KAI7242540.1 hypothetical protein KC352_g14688 [Hortaea werneckii]KAI7568859.1 hypothetical protein KC317_g3816 [Hortaea werneckii]KAI7618252.1 hypothetical protein KC346_g5106 [Hortaea werneckii]KAI7630402.1 hypothetical protein KC343_g4647 [Hortaea werneckii]
MAPHDNPADEQHLGITAVEAIASYNWLNSQDPTLLVPGTPPLWHPPEKPVHLPPDTGTFFIDPNAGLSPSSPLEPLFRAVLHQHPAFSFSDLDLITDRWALSRFLSSKDDWSLGAQVVKGKIFFVRLEPEKEITIQPHEFRGFRRNFEKAFLQYPEACRESRAHYQIITYKLGGLNIMLRHAAAGYFAAAKSTDQPLDVETAPSSMSARYTSPTATTTPMAAAQQQGNLRLMTAGTRIPRSALFELSTSKKVSTLEGYKKFEVPEQWIAQTRGYIRAAPTQTRWDRQTSKIRGMFSKEAMDVRRVEAGREIAEWERENQDRIRRLCGRLDDVIRRLRGACHGDGSGGGECFVLQPEQGRGTIRIRAAGADDGVRGLPRDLIERLGQA